MCWSSWAGLAIVTSRRRPRASTVASAQAGVLCHRSINSLGAWQSSGRRASDAELSALAVDGHPTSRSSEPTAGADAAMTIGLATEAVHKQRYGGHRRASAEYG